MQELSISLKLLPEFEVDVHTHQQLTKLRNTCFEDSERKRDYFKQLPHSRLLAYKDHQPIAQIGLEHRVISANNKILRIFGLIDVCVLPTHRGVGLASGMLDHVTHLAERTSVDFLIAFATDHRIYLKNGFLLVSNYFQWLRIHEHKNYGVGIEKIENEVMVKCIRDTQWPNGPIDLLGYLF